MAEQQELIDQKKPKKPSVVITPQEKEKKLEERKAKLLEQLKELDRKEKRIKWTQDDKRKHANHLKMMLVGEVIKAARADEKLKDKLVKILEVSKEAVKSEEKKFEYDEIISML